MSDASESAASEYNIVLRQFLLKLPVLSINRKIGIPFLRKKVRQHFVPSTEREAVFPLLQHKARISVPSQLRFPLQKKQAVHVAKLRPPTAVSVWRAIVLHSPGSIA